MALIDPKNLITPLSNKVHLTFIFLFAVLIVIFRVSGGKIATTALLHGSRSSQTAVKAGATPRAAESVKGQPARATREHPPTPPTAAGTEAEDQEGLDAVLRNSKPVAPWGEPPKSGTAKPRERVPADGSLDDIERQLGLR